MAKTFGAAAAAKKSAPAATKTQAAEAPATKSEYSLKPEEFGVFKNITGKESGRTFQAIEVLQDMTLKKGQLLAFQSLEDELQWLVDKDHITEEVKEERTEKLGTWLIGKFRLMKPKN
jgi:ABC-type branched-subunit amino acid transport system ATPase component